MIGEHPFILCVAGMFGLATGLRAAATTVIIGLLRPKPMQDMSLIFTSAQKILIWAAASALVPMAAQYAVLVISRVMKQSDPMSSLELRIRKVNH